MGKRRRGRRPGRRRSGNGSGSTGAVGSIICRSSALISPTFSAAIKASNYAVLGARSFYPVWTHVQYTASISGDNISPAILQANLYDGAGEIVKTVSPKLVSIEEPVRTWRLRWPNRSTWFKSGSTGNIVQVSYITPPATDITKWKGAPVNVIISTKFLISDYTFALQSMCLEPLCQSVEDFHIVEAVEDAIEEGTRHHPSRGYSPRLDACVLASPRDGTRLLHTPARSATGLPSTLSIH